MTSAQIRTQFLDFFVKKHGHTFVRSSPVVPLDDPTLLFTNAGMNQFKPIFLGQEKPPFTRAANTQKCIRAGGKHNDLDDVGRSRRHHTFFEMLGNWSFGDYFKQGAIEMAWELLTKVWNLDPARLHVSCYEGDEKAGVPRDLEAADLWKKIAGMPDDHIHFFGKDNFWEMGDTGPCGPCTEIYYDRTPDKSGGPQVNGSDPAVMEIWNLVFIQYNRDAAGKLTTLPAQHVDTGMGFERICQVLQGKEDNYGTDLWTPLFDAIHKLSGKKYTGKFTKTNAADPVAEADDEQLRHDIAFRVVADHARCLTFALTDGAVPSNEGRGYVLRRILRRAVFYGRQHLGLAEPFIHKLVPVLVESMGEAFPELKKNPTHVAELIRDEESSFEKTLGRGMQVFEEDAERAAGRAAAARKFGFAAISELPYSVVGVIDGPPNPQSTSHVPMISAIDAFTLHDTFGFPIDLTRVMAEEQGMTVDVNGFQMMMEKAKETSRAGGKEGESSVMHLTPDALASLGRNQMSATTEDFAKFHHDSISARVTGIWDGNEMCISSAVSFEKGEIAVILDRTNFYAEMGGQIGDTGELLFSGGVFEVKATRNSGYVLHVGQLKSGALHVGDTVQAIVSPARIPTEKNHTATHLANWALREVLGEGVQQKGSLVDPEKLRFDFSQSKSLADDQIAKVESLVTKDIQKNLPVFAQVAPQEKALKIAGLRAVFGEKYPPMVRIVSVGAPVDELLADPENPKWRQFSIEFCGGTHLQNSAEIQGFAITAEESVSKGIRRIVAVTGETAAAVQSHDAVVLDLVQRAEKISDSEVPALIADLQKAVGGQLSLLAKRRGQTALAQLQARQKTLEKSQKSSAPGIDAVSAAAALLSKAASFGQGKLIVGQIPGATSDNLLSAVDSLRKKSPTHAILLGSIVADQVALVAAVSDDLIARGLKAGDWVKQTAQLCGGGGGGRPQLAQGSGKNPAKLNDALESARTTAQTKLA